MRPSYYLWRCLSDGLTALGSHLLSPRVGTVTSAIDPIDKECALKGARNRVDREHFGHQNL